MSTTKFFPSTSYFPLEISSLERQTLEACYLDLRKNYKGLKISRGLLLSHSRSKSLLIEQNQLLEKTKRELESRIEEIETSEAAISQPVYEILQEVVDVFRKMEDTGNELVLGYEEYEKGKRSFAGARNLGRLIPSVITFYNVWKIIKDQIKSIQQKIKAMSLSEEETNKQLK